MSNDTPSSSEQLNPFLGLFDQSAANVSIPQTSSTSSSSPISTKHLQITETDTGTPNEDGDGSSKSNLTEIKINEILEDIFLITISKNVKLNKQFVYMEDIASLCDNNDYLLNIELLEQALFERLLLITPQDFLIPNDKQIIDDSNHVIETKVIHYLYRSFEKLEQFKLNDNQNYNLDEIFEKINSLIMRNVCTSIKQPELYAGQTLSSQWFDILKDCDSDVNVKNKFLNAMIDELQQQQLQENDNNVNDDHENENELIVMGYLKSIFYPMLTEITKMVRDSNMVNLNKRIIDVLILFVSNKIKPQLGKLVIDFTTPNPDTEGKAFSDTLFGQLLSLSILPKYQNGPYEYYSNPSEATSSTYNSSLWLTLRKHLDDMHLIFRKLLTINDEIKSKTLIWIGNCLNANIPRGQIWVTHNLTSLGHLTSAPDSFMIGLCGVLLRLCTPLFKPNLKVLLVDPTYSAITEDERLEKCVHLKNVSKETCLLPIENDEKRLTANSYNFITECFFMTHKAIDLSYRVCIEMFMRMAREINKLQSAYEDALAQGGNDVAQNIMQMLTSLMQQFVCLKHTLAEPQNDQYLLQMCEATAIWLTEITAKTEEDVKLMNSTVGYAPKERNTNLKLPLTNYVPSYLNCVPEYLIQNILSYLTFMRHFENQAIRFDIDAQCSILRMILIFIGSIERVRNPHLRAELADGLESLLPKENSSTFTGTFKTKLFDVHPDRLEIVPNLLNVFVSIEMTGQSVQFEQKFQYRRPMYAIMEFLWERQEQKEIFKKLAYEAEIKIEEINPPIFLRFINLLINDAIHLLDESLTNLQQIRTLQTTQDSGEWNNLPSRERQRNIAGLQQLGTLTRFDNILGRDTINMLKLLTSEIKGIFCHKSMVDRVAAMLNYFLLNLVGPKKREFMVKDKKEFEFDPAHTVKDICNIYVNLKECDEFCLAVSQDGRSYSSELFEYADQILRRIGGGQLIGDMNEFAIKVQQIEKQHKEDQEALTDIPDDYLDPIMSTLMMDPVILPSSRVTVDRSTIARHLLSDQSDPFNRSPLTMDQIKPNNELKDEIMEWIKQKRKEYNEKQQQQQREQLQNNDNEELMEQDQEQEASDENKNESS